MLKSILLAVLLLLIAGVISIYQVSQTHNHEALQRDGVKTMGTTDGVSTKTKKGNTTYYLSVQYGVGSIPYRETLKVPKPVFARYSTDNRFATAQPIEVRYLARNPKIFEITAPGIPADYYAPSMIMWIIAGAVGVIGLAYLGSAVAIAMKKKVEPPPTG